MRENVLPMGNSPGGAIRPIGLYRIRHILLRKHQLSGKFTTCGSNRGLLRSLRSLSIDGSDVACCPGTFSTPLYSALLWLNASFATSK